MTISRADQLSVMQGQKSDDDPGCTPHIFAAERPVFNTTLRKSQRRCSNSMYRSITADWIPPAHKAQQ